MKRSEARRKMATELFTVHIDDLTHEGQGVARRDGKAVFVEGGLPGEDVECVYTVRRNRRDERRRPAARSLPVAIQQGCIGKRRWLRYRAVLRSAVEEGYGEPRRQR